MRNQADFEKDYAYVKGCLDGIMSAKNDRIPDDFIDKMAQLRVQMESLTQDFTGSTFQSTKALNISPLSSRRRESDDSEKIIRPQRSSQRPTSESAKGEKFNKGENDHGLDMITKVEHARLQRHISEEQISSARKQKAFLPSNCKELRRAWSERDFERAYKAEASAMKPFTAECYRESFLPPLPIAKDINTPRRSNHTHKRKSKSLNTLVEIDPARRAIKLFPVDQNFDKDMYSIIKATKIVGTRQASSTRNWELSPQSNEWIKEEDKSNRRGSRMRDLLFASKGSRAMSVDARLPGVAV